MEEQKSKNPLIITIVVLIILAVAGYGFWKYSKKEDSLTATPTPTPTPTPTTEPVGAPLQVYKDGTYSATGFYMSPSDEESILVQITLKGDKIVDAKTVSNATRENSVKFQGIFVANFKPLVVGKKIDEVKLSKVSGSSLTSKGFHDALEKIKAQARA